MTGQTVQTRWGPVQVQLTVASKKITAVTVLQSPTGNGRDIEINSAALPILKQETLQAQNAKIDSVSGATYTSDGYVTSLQSALVQARHRPPRSRSPAERHDHRPLTHLERRPCHGRLRRGPGIARSNRRPRRL